MDFHGITWNRLSTADVRTSMSNNTVARRTATVGSDSRPAGSDARRRFVAALLVAVVSSVGVAACSTDDSTTSDDSTTDPGPVGQHDDITDTVETAPEAVQLIDPDERRPILATKVLPDDHIPWMGGVPEIAVYANGRVVTWEVSHEHEVQVRAGMVDSDLIRLVEGAERAGLTGGGFERLEPPSQEATGEHAGAWFLGARAADGVWTIRTVPHLGGHAPDAHPATLAGIAELRDALHEVASRATEVVDIPRWVVVSLPGTPLENVGWNWQAEGEEALELLPELSDPDTSWTRFGTDAGGDPLMGRPLAGGLCLVVDQPTWAAPPGSLNQMPFELDGRLHKLVLRPLMPHEHDCDDVAQTMAELPL